ncbi:MAG TPA: type II toxin-antitoxin system prevent-host-death family antitoxin [Thermoanaerobaculia bacterium]|nr:type II toxin-antitoxin system prevent-host-death family antitoxin [Thermoanaerobaculia bacterium]
MTRKPETRKRTHSSRPGRWSLQDAKARFSEVVRKAKTEGPQRITVHGREEVVVVSVEEYRRVKGQRTGQALVQVLQNSPLLEITVDHEPTYGPVRGVEL